MTYQSSQLSLASSGLTMHLRFTPPSFELKLQDEAKRTSVRANFTADDLRRVTLDMRPVEAENIKLSYAARHILIEVKGKLFARVLDVDFMRLHNAAAVGVGETVLADESAGLR